MSNTGTVCGLLAAPGAVTKIVPDQVPTAKPAVLTDTATGDVTPLEGDTLSQLPPETVDAVALQFKLPPPKFNTESFWGGGLAPP